MPWAYFKVIGLFHIIFLKNAELLVSFFQLLTAETPAWILTLKSSVKRRGVLFGGRKS